MPLVRKFNYFCVEKILKLLSIMKKIYIRPMSEEVKIETSQILAGSTTGLAGSISGEVPNSDDSEFGYAKEHRETWGDLWETEN